MAPSTSSGHSPRSFHRGSSEYIRSKLAWRASTSSLCDFPEAIYAPHSAGRTLRGTLDRGSWAFLLLFSTRLLLVVIGSLVLRHSVLVNQIETHSSLKSKLSQFAQA